MDNNDLQMITGGGNSLLLRRRMMMRNIEQGLPEEYQEVEYLQSNGSQYIDLHCRAGANCVADITLSMSGEHTGYFNGIFGSMTDANNADSFCLYANRGNPLQVGVNFVARANNSAYTFSNAVDFHKISLKRAEKAIYADDIKVLSIGSGTASTGPYLLLFTYNTGGDSSPFIPYFIGKIKSIDIDGVNDTIKTRRFVACRRKTDNKPGYYDLSRSICPLTGTPFFINSGTGEFTAGPDVINPLM